MKAPRSSSAPDQTCHRPQFIIRIISADRLDEFPALVNQAKDRMVHSYDDQHWDSAEVAIGAIQWGDFPYC